MPGFMIDHQIWVMAAHAVAAIAGGLSLLRASRQDLKFARAAAVHSFLGVWFSVLGTGHLVAVIIKVLARTLSSHSDPFLLLALGLAIALPGFLMTLASPGIAAGRPDCCRTAAASDLWLSVLLLLTVPPLALAPALGLVLLLTVRVPWPPSAVTKTLRRIGSRKKTVGTIGP